MSSNDSSTKCDSGDKSSSPSSSAGDGDNTSNTNTTNDANNSKKDSNSSSVKPPTMTEYCQSLETWLNNVYIQRACATSAYFTAYSLIFGNNTGLLNAGRTGSQTSNQAQGAGGNMGNVMGNVLYPARPGAGNNVGFFRGFGGVNPYQYPDTLRIAPIWRRLLAELFDFLVLLVVKVFVTLSIIENFQLLDLENIDIDLIQDSGSIYDIAISLTSELIVLEFIHRIVVCFFEAYCLSKNGCTPGKNLFRLRVIHCEAIQESNNRLVITPGVPLTFSRALLRSLIKNFSIALFFPMCFTLLHFENNQTLYDHVSKSIVVCF